MKNLIIIIGIALIINFSYAQEYKLKGVVTYYFNQYQGNKPDLGAKVYLIPKDSVDSSYYETVKDVIEYNRIQNMLLLYPELTEKEVKYYEKYKAQKEEIESKKQESKKVFKYANAKKYVEQFESRISNRNNLLKDLKKVTSKYDVDFDEISKSSVEMNIKLIMNSKYKDFVDATGSFEVEANEGVYYVLIQSKNRKRTNDLEVLGCQYWTQINLNKNESITHNFHLY